MARRSKKEWALFGLVSGIASNVGIFVALQLPLSGLSKLYAMAVAAVLGPTLTALILPLFTAPKRKSFYDEQPGSTRSTYGLPAGADPWLKEEVDQYPLWQQATGRAHRASRQRKESKPTAWNLDLLRSLEWHRLELLSKAYFEALGFRAELTPFGPDGGVDINLYADGQENRSIVVQCKAWNTWSVGVKQLRELFGVMSAENVVEGIFITTGKYTSDAKDFANKARIDLIDGPDLIRKITALDGKTSQALLKIATVGDFITPTCPSCGKKMVDRISRTDASHFWGCLNYPRCKQRFDRGVMGAANASS
jgi:hypothetical protein